MPINPAIAMSFQAPKFEDPMNNMIKMEQIKAYQQNALAKQLEAEIAQESLGQQRGLSNYLAGLEPGASPDMNMLARFGKTGREYGKDITEAQSKQMEMASKLYKEMYLPILGQAKTRDDVLAWHTAMEQDPRLKGFLTPQGKAMLPKSDAEVPSYLETTLIPISDRYKRETAEAANQARLDAAARTAAGRVQAAQIQAGAPQRPFQIGSNLVSAAGDVLYSGDEEKPITDWKEQRSPDGTLQYFSPSTGKTVSSTGLPTKGMGGAAGGKTSTQIAKDEAASGAIDNLNLIFDKIGPAYEELARENAISDPDKGVWYNVIAAAKSSETGKALGQAVGSKAAQARNEIDVLTTAFISQLSKATGLTASQLNSNLEFQTFRRMLESKDIVTARESIDLLRGMFAKRIPSNPKEVTQTFGAVNRQMEKSKESPESGEAQNRPSLQSIFE